MDDPDAWTPDATPFVEGYDVAPDAVPPMVGVGVPAVVAVVITRNPGPWLEALLTSVSSQEYANLTTLVIDAGSVVDPTQRVAEILPNAFVKRVEGASFATAANAALGTIEGASFFLFLHDDVELGPGTVQAMVEEAFRSNAGIVGAKLVDWDDPQHLRSVGGSIDKFGFPWPIAEPDELDQAQHDAVREAFVVSTAAMMVRCDLFADLRGFATDIDGAAEDLDLCWRARVAGARTVVMPAAVVRHRERSELGDPTGRSQGLALRHQARVILACYSPVQILRILPQAIVLAVIDVLASLVRGQVRAAGEIAAAVTWNLGHLPATLKLRGRVKRSRRTPDEEIRRMQVKGSVRVNGFLRRYTSGDRSVASTLAAAARGLPGARAEADGGMWTLLAVLVGAVVLLGGSRGLISSGIPVIREFVPLGRPSSLLAEWWAGWRSVGMGSPSGAPTVNLVAALASWATFGSTGLVRTVLILAPLPLGAVATWRVLKGCASPGARFVGLVAYLVNPLPYNAVAEGRWQSLVVYAALPSVLGRVARAGGWEPFDRAVPAPGSTQRQAVGLGLVVAAATTIAPVTAAVTLFVALIVIAVMSAATRSGRPLRALTVVGGGLAVSAALHLPWTLAVLSSSNRWSILLGGDPGRRAPLGLDRAVMFDTGPHGGVLAIGLLVGAGVALLISSGDRFRWVLTAMVLVVAGFGAVVLAGRLAPSVGFPLPEVSLAVVAAAIGLALPLGVDAFRGEVVGGAFGWRQVFSLVAAVAVVISTLPLLVDLVDGRWQSPVSDTEVALVPIRSQRVVAPFRTLWIGDADALSVAGWRLTDGMKFALTDDVSPTLSSLFPPAMRTAEQRLRHELLALAEGGSSRLGAALAPYGVRYVVVQQRLAPLPYGRTVMPIDATLDEQLHQQFDLSTVEVAPGLEVYENLAALPVRSTTDSLVAESLAGPSAAAGLVGDRPEVDEWSATGRPPTTYRGAVGSDRSLLVAQARDANWSLTVGRRTVEAKPLFGWGSRYDVADGGRATLTYSMPAAQVVLHLLQLLVVVAIPWTRRRRVSERRVRWTRSREEAVAP